MPLLEIDRLDAGYGRLQILFEVSLSVDKGVTLVQGKNGSGKSTLLKAIVGLTEVSGGRILFRDQEITRLKPERIIQRGIGYVPQRRNVFLELSVVENLEMGRLSSQDSLSLAEIDHLFPELTPYHAQKASILSGGERQLLAIARGIRAKPRLLILDEPSAGLAPAVAERLFSRLRLLSPTVLLIEQNISLASLYADQGHLLDQGRILDTA